MSKEFVIVIEADNKRAQAAYRKGLEDLDLVLPQLLQVAQEQDAQEQASYDVALAAQMEAWHAEAPVLELDSCWLPGQVQRAKRNHEHAMRMHEINKPGRYDSLRSDRNKWRVRSLESVRAELQRNYNIASLATGPYRMTEHQVTELIAWEDGSRVEQLKRAYLPT